MKTFTTRLLTTSLILFFTFVSSVSFAQATFTNAHFFDTNTDGSIDEVVIEMSGGITDATIVLGDFDIGGSAPLALLTGDGILNLLDPDVIDDNYFTFQVNLVGTGVSTVAYTMGTLSDGLPTATNLGITTVDSADPILIAASSTPLDGTTDVTINTNVVLTFSENVQGGTGNVELIDVTNVGADTRTIAIGDDQLGFSTNTLTINPSMDLDNLVNYAVNADATAIYDTAAPDNSYAGIGDSTTMDFTTIGSIPTFNATWLDDGDGDIDQLQIDFSEAVSFTDGNGTAGIFDGITVTGGIALTNPGSVDYATVVGVLKYAFDVSGVTGTGSPSETISYGAGAQNDITADAGGQQLNGSPSAVIDGADPVFIDATFYDITTVDGIVDEILLEFSEDIDETSVDDADFDIGSAGLGTETFSVTAGASANNVVDTNDNDVYVTLAISLNSTDDRSVVYTQNNDVTDVADAAGNQALDDGTILTFDLANPVLTDVQIEDTSDDGFIDQVTYVFSEIVIDPDGGGDPDENEFGTFTFPDGISIDQSDNIGDGNVTLSNDGIFGYLTLNVTGEQGTENTAVGATDVTNAVSHYQDDQALVAQEITENVIDVASPAIIGVIISGNSIASVFFSEAVWTDAANTSPVDETDFTFSLTGGLTPTLPVDDVNDTGTLDPGETLNITGGETEANVFFSYVGTAAGGETFTMDTGGSIYDNANNTAAATQFPTANQDVLIAPNIPSMVSAEWLDQDANGQIDAISIRFNIDWDVDEPDGGDGGDGLDCFTITYGATTVTQDGVDYDNVPTNGFNVVADPLILTFAGDEIPTQTGINTLAIIYATGTNDGIESVDTQDEMLNGSVPAIYLDGAAPHFNNNFSATAYDTDVDGNIDQIVVDALDHIEDGSIDPSEFTYNGIATTGVTNIDNTDESFTLVVTGSGTAIEGDLVYSGTMLLDSASNASTTGTIMAAAIVDAAGPVILTAETLDTEVTPDGMIDEILVTFSEDLANVFGDDTYFSVDDGGTNYPVTVATPGAADEVTLTITESGGFDTEIVPDVSMIAGYGDDAASALTPIQTFTNTDDGAAPYGTVDTLSTADDTPPITGTVDDVNANVLVNIGAQTVPATNIGGVWSVADNTFTALATTTHEVIAILIDPFGNTGFDVTSSELAILADVTIMAPNFNECLESGYFTFDGPIIFTETDVAGISGGGTVDLLLPVGFEFNTSVLPTPTGVGDDIASVSFTFPSDERVTMTITLEGGNGVDELDVLGITGLQVRAIGTTPYSNVKMTRSGGTASISANATDYADLSSLSIESTLTDVQETGGGTFITEWVVKRTATTVIPHAAVIVSAGNGTFDDNEAVSFSGGAVGVIVPRSSTGTQIEVFLTSGTTVANGETITGDGGDNALVNGAPTAGTGYIEPFTFIASPVGLEAQWWNAETSSFISNVSAQDNTALGMTTEGLYSLDVYDYSGTCLNVPLRVKVLVYDDTDTEIFGSNTFEDTNFIITDEAYSFYVSNPAGHIITVTGAGTTVTNPADTKVLVTFDPGIAGDATHIITYTITNDVTGDQFIETATFDVLLPTETFTVTAPINICMDDLPYSLTFAALQPGQVLGALGFEHFTLGQREFWYRNDNSNLGAPSFQEEFGATFPYTFNLNPSPSNVDPFTTWTGAQTSNNPFDVPDGDGVALRTHLSLQSPSLIIQQNIFIHGAPVVNVSNVATFYCFDDAGFTLQRDASYVSGWTAHFPGNSGTLWSPIYTSDVLDITTGYELWKETAVPGVYALYEDFTGANGTGSGMTLMNDLDPNDPDQDGNSVEDELGNYRIMYSSEGLTDGSCSGSATFDFTIEPLPADPDLHADHGSDGGGSPWYDVTDMVNGMSTIVLEFCEVSEFFRIFPDTYDTQLNNWYEDELGTLPIPLNAAPSGDGWIQDTDIQSANNAIFDFNTGTFNLYFARVVNGCESPIRKVSVYIYDPTDIPIATTTAINEEVETGQRYVYEFCDAYLPITLNTLNGLDSEPDSRNDEAHFNIYDKMGVFINSISSSTLNAVDFGGVAASGVTKKISISQVWNDETALPLPWLNATYQFAGCESALVDFEIKVTTTPLAPVAADFTNLNLTTLHICEGDLFANIQTFGTGIDKYVWYETNGTTEIARIANGDFISQSVLETSFFDSNSSGVYTFRVTKINSIGTETFFAGCESQAGTFIIEVHAVDDTDFPIVRSSDYNNLGDVTTNLDWSSITAYSIGDDVFKGGNNWDALTNNTNNDPEVSPGDWALLGTDANFGNAGADFLFPVCIDDLVGTNVLTAASNFAAGPKDFIWYESNASYATQVELGGIANNTAPTFDELGMGLGDILSAQSKYFLVSQRTDTDDFPPDGACESALALTRLEVVFSGLGALTVDLGGVSDYCQDDSDFTMTLEVGGIDVNTLTGPTASPPNGLDTRDVYWEARMVGTSTVLGGGSETGVGYPVADLTNWFSLAGGITPEVAGNSVTVDVYIEFTDPWTACVGNTTIPLRIHPNPDLTFAINGFVPAVVLDVGGTPHDGAVVCYDDADVFLDGFFSDFSPLNPIGTTFSYSGTGISDNSDGSATFDPSGAHGGDPYLNQSLHVITFSYTDEYGCSNTVQKTLIVDPRPEIFDVERLVALPVTDLAESRPANSNSIRLTNFCNDGSNVDATIEMVDPTDTDPGDDFDTYAGYTFDWTVNGVYQGQVVGSNTLNFAPPSNSLSISVVVNDGNGCSDTFNESHDLQTLSSLNITGITDNEEFCSDDGSSPIDIGLTDATLDGNGATNMVNEANITSWTIMSYSSDNLTPALSNSGSGALPDLNLEAMHTDTDLLVPGNAYVGGQSVGGPITYHTITVDYLDPSREYQGSATLCNNSVSETIVINPASDVTFTVNGVDVNNVNFAEFCYDDGNVTLKGFLTDGTPLTSGNFTSTATGAILTTSGEGIFDTDDEHDNYHLVGAGLGVFQPQSDFTLRYTYTDGNSCLRFVEADVHVNPRPSAVGVVDINQVKFTQICDDDALTTDAYVIMYDPTDGVTQITNGVGFNFQWIINGAAAVGYSNVNTHSFSTSGTTISVVVVVTDLTTGCSVTISEIHNKQVLPDLNITGIFGGKSYCTDHADEDLGLTDGGVNVTDLTDVISWSVYSYGTNMPDTVTVAVNPAGLGVGLVDSDLTGDSLPDVLITNWHESSAMTAPGQSVGGNSTIHTVFITYEDDSRSYQGNQTLCSTTVAETIVIHPQPDIDIAYDLGGDLLYTDDPEGLQFCYDDRSIDLRGVFTDLTDLSFSTGGLFTGNGVSGTSNNQTTFDPSDAHDDFHGTGGGGAEFLAQSINVITFSYTDQFGCFNSTTKTLIVNPLPEVEGSVGNQIVYDAICLGYETEAHVVIYQPGTTTEVVSYAGYTFDWVTTEASATVVGDPSVTLPVATNLSVGMTLTVNSPDGCTTVILDTDAQGFPPIPSFNYVGITANAPAGLDITFQENSALLPDADINLLEFTMTGPSPSLATVVSEIRNSNDLSSLNVMGLTAGEYSATVRMATALGCNAPDSTRLITILPVETLGDPITGGGYAENFETDLGGWFFEYASEDGKNDTTRNSSWKRMELNSVSTTNDDILSDGRGNIIVTQAPEAIDPETLASAPTSYYEGEVSYVYTPAFDFNQYTSPALKFDYIRDFESSRDGLVVQVTDDDGRTWQTLGDDNINSGINWYTNQGISAGPGDSQGRFPETSTSPQLVGFADVPFDEDDNRTPGWLESRHQITRGLYQSNFIRFRFALSALTGAKIDAFGEIFDGFAFDNFELYDINKLLVVEQFSSTLSADSKRNEEFLQTGQVDGGGPVNHSIDWEAGTQGVWINYYTGVYNDDVNEDPINARNKVDPATRATFFGVTDVPDNRISGTDVPYDLDDTPEDFGNGFNALSLFDADFNINKNHPTLPDDIVLNTSADDVVSVTTTFRSLADETQDVEVGFFFAIVEKVKTGVTSGVYGSADNIRYPLRALLPGPAGEYYKGPLTNGQLFTYTMDWPITEVDNPDNLRVIAFAQYYSHPNANKVGSIEQAVWVDLAGAGKISLVTGLEDLITNDVLEVYPNSANNVINLTLPEAPSEDVFWTIYDQSGRQAMRGLIKRGTKTPSPIDSSDLPSGMYIIQLHNEKQTWTPKKVLISH